MANPVKRGSSQGSDGIIGVGMFTFRGQKLHIVRESLIASSAAMLELER